MNNRIIILLSLTFFTGYSQGSSVIWTGEKITFSKLALGDADALTSNVTLKRGANSGLYNNVSETENTSISPADTRWAYGTTQDDLSSLSFDTFKNAVGQGNQGNKPPMGSDLVLHLVTDDIYMDITFLTWETNGNYSYERSSPNGIGILLNGTVSAENNQIKNVADPTDAQDAVTKSYVESLLSDYQSQIDNLQDQIDALQASSGSGTVTDQDGNSYPYLTYGNQAWTVKNAEVVTYRDGTEIPQVTDATQWANLTTGAWCYYDNDSSKGKLYNWYAVAGIHDTDPNTPNKELAPLGWNIPEKSEAIILENYLIANGYNYDGTTTGNKIAKALSSSSGWDISTNEGVPGNNQIENDSSGFNAPPIGYRTEFGVFAPDGNTLLIWFIDENDLNTSARLMISNDYYSTYWLNSKKTKGFSVRFVRD